MISSKLLTAVALAATLAFSVAACAPAAPPTSSADAQELARYREAERIGQQHLAVFDTLDFDVYSNQRWDRLSESHADNILVHYPDGHTTRGLPDHIDELKKQFVFAPDTRIREHPIKIESGEWTSVVGTMEGHFTRPMPTAHGEIPPTNRAFNLRMVTVGHWVNGKMDEEYLFWDNAAFAQQIGLTQ